jgi:hypothetical protein
VWRRLCWELKLIFRDSGSLCVCILVSCWDFVYPSYFTFSLRGGSKFLLVLDHWPVSTFALFVSVLMVWYAVLGEFFFEIRFFIYQSDD